MGRSLVKSEDGALARLWMPSFICVRRPSSRMYRKTSLGHLKSEISEYGAVAAATEISEKVTDPSGDGPRERRR